MIPVVFRTPRFLAALNVAAVGLAISAVTTAVFMLMWVEVRSNWALIVGLPTIFVGSVWAAVLRLRERLGRISIGWVLSIPLAALNSALACALLFTRSDHEIGSFVAGMFVGATFGIVIWAPALILVLVMFGLPIAHARDLACEGLAGEERGERFVGIVSALLAVGALLLSRLASSQAGFTLLTMIAAASFACGMLAALFAEQRERRRRRFVARVEAEEVPGLRIETRTQGKVLLRIEPHIETYRLPPHPDEELFELDQEGRVLKPIGIR